MQVYIAYCDGGYLSGDNASTTIHKGTELWFRGAAILDAVLDDLSARHGLRAATDVVMGGCSGRFPRGLRATVRVRVRIRVLC